MRGTCFREHALLRLYIVQMPIIFSDAEIRRLRDHEALLTHVGITASSDSDCQVSMDRILSEILALMTQEIPELKKYSKASDSSRSRT